MFYFTIIIVVPVFPRQKLSTSIGCYELVATVISCADQSCKLGVIDDYVACKLLQYITLLLNNEHV